MNLRSRLTLAIAGVLLVTLVAAGVTLVRTTEAALIDQVDEQVVSNAIPPDGGGGGDPDQRQQDEQSDDPVASPQYDRAISYAYVATAAPYEPSEQFPRERVIGHFIYSPNGELIFDEPCGFSDNPKSPPLIPPIPSDDLEATIDRIVTTPSVDGSVDYRVLTQRGYDGNVLVTASALDRVDAAINDLQRMLLVIGLMALTASIAAAWWLIRRGLRPVDQMVETAAAIAAGDLTRRVPHANPHTELGRLGGALNDMLHQIEDSLLVRTRSEERLRRFVSDAAHELRTPLTSVRGYAELYRKGAFKTDDDVAGAMSRIESEGNRMARLVDELLLLARLDQQRGLEPQPVDLVELVKESTFDFRVVAPDHPLSTDLVDSAIVSGDPLRLRQVIDNLLTNARTHTPAGTPVIVSLQQIGDRIELVVADLGPGIPADAQDLIFERFWRADGGRSRSRGGSGLGLAIAGAIIEAHDGQIAVMSEPGKGATFTVTLPAG